MTLDLIKNLMQNVNQKGFNGKLRLDFPVSLVANLPMAACIEFQQKTSFVESLKVNSNITLEVVEDTIAHEMIHVYEIQVLNKYPRHEANFIREMNRLNKLGYNITVELDEADLYKTVSYILSENQTRICFFEQDLNINESDRLYLSKSEGLGRFSTGKIKVSGRVLKSYTVSPDYKTYQMIIDEKNLNQLGIKR